MLVNTLGVLRRIKLTQEINFNTRDRSVTCSVFTVRDYQDHCLLGSFSYLREARLVKHSHYINFTSTMLCHVCRSPEKLICLTDEIFISFRDDINYQYCLIE